MSDGWRNRYMAPAYALVISFVIVLILGYALREPAATEPTPNPTAPSTTGSPVKPTTSIFQHH